MVARRERGHSAPPLVARRRLRDRSVGAAELERAGALQVLRLQQHVRAGERIQLARAQHRRAHRPAVEDARRPAHLVEVDGVGEIRHGLESAGRASRTALPAPHRRASTSPPAFAGRPCQSTAASTDGSVVMVRSGLLHRPLPGRERAVGDPKRIRPLAQAQLHRCVEGRRPRRGRTASSAPAPPHRRRSSASPCGKCLGCSRTGPSARIDRLELHPPRGQLVERRARAGGSSVVRGHDARRLQLAQPLREHVGPHQREACAQIGEPLGAQQQLAHDEERPPLTRPGRAPARSRTGQRRSDLTYGKS